MLFLCALAVSCAGETSESVDDKPIVGTRQIGFSTLLESRGAAMTAPKHLAQNGGFKVWAYTHAAAWSSSPSTGTLFDATTVTGNGEGTLWSYGTPVTWPEDRFVSFFACGPAATASFAGFAADGIPKIAFAVNAVPRNQADFVIAHPVYDQAGAYYSVGSGVRMRFEHALSRIIFSGLLLNENDARQIRIRSVTINGLYDSGTAALSTTPIAWEVDDQRTASYTVSTSGGELSNSVVLSPESKYVTTETGYLFLMPQSLQRTPGNQPTMTVTLDIDGHTVAYPPTTLFTPEVWEPGKTYKYEIVVDGNDLRIIGVEDVVNLRPWEISVYVNPVMMVDDSREVNERKINAAMEILEKLSMEGYPDPELSPTVRCNHFAIYFSGVMDMDVTVDMDDYPGFRLDDVVMLDAKKLVTVWGHEGERDPNDGMGGNGGNYTLEAKYNPDEWELMDAMQPWPDIWSEPVYPELDATSGPTTNPTQDPEKSYNHNAPQAAIRNKGSIILQKIKEVENP